jgi:hypothetical protein
LEKWQEAASSVQTLCLAFLQEFPLAEQDALSLALSVSMGLDLERLASPDLQGFAVPAALLAWLLCSCCGIVDFSLVPSTLCSSDLDTHGMYRISGHSELCKLGNTRSF